VLDAGFLLAKSLVLEDSKSPVLVIPNELVYIIMGAKGESNAI
jgi:hypothetical protein